MTNLRLNVKEQSKIASGKTDCAVLLVGSDLKLDSAARAVAKSSAGLVEGALASGDFTGSAGETLMLRSTGEASRVLLLGIGDNAADRIGLRKACVAMAKALPSSKAKDAIVHLSATRGLRKELPWLCRTLAHTLTYHSYRYTHTVSSPKPASPLKKLTLSVADAASAKLARSAATAGAATAQGTNLARELANRPGNYCTPEHLAKEARRLARSSDKASCKVLNEKAMAELGMHSLLSVTAGTATPAKLIVLEYRGGKRGDAPHALVGKGITFDSGGISLKPGAKMDEMKFDMGGAASVLGTMQSVIDMKLPVNVVAIIAAAENMPSGTATKPGDVVTSMAGITIEVLNTDAEGRLVLCDALTYAAKYKPASVVDIATLTGACVVALGSQASALYANDEALAADLLSAGEESYDRAWRMPLWDEYQKQLDSNFADVANIGGPAAGSVTAACFLARFTKAYRWAHLDIAGSAWDSSPKGATGRPVGLLTQYLCDRAGVS